MNLLFAILFALGTLLGGSGPWPGQSVIMPGPGNSSAPPLWTHLNSTTLGSGTSPYTVSLGFTPPAGSLLIVPCSSVGSSIAVADNSSGPSDSYVLVGPSPSSTYPYVAGFATVVTSGTPPTTVTCTSGTGNVHLAVDNYGGGPPTITLDGSATSTVTTGTTCAVSFTTGSQAGDLLWSYESGASSVYGPVDSPFTIRVNSNYGIVTADDGIPLGVAAGTQQTATYHQSSQPTTCVIVGFER